MGETVFVIVIAATVGFLTARRVYRSLSGKDEGCAGGCGDCRCEKRFPTAHAQQIGQNAASTE